MSRRSASNCRFLEEERATMGDRCFQEYFWEFMDSASDLFDRDLVEQAISYDFESPRIH